MRLCLQWPVNFFLSCFLAHTKTNYVILARRGVKQATPLRSPLVSSRLFRPGQETYNYFHIESSFANSNKNIHSANEFVSFLLCYSPTKWYYLVASTSLMNSASIMRWSSRNLLSPSPLNLEGGQGRISSYTLTYRLLLLFVLDQSVLIIYAYEWTVWMCLRRIIICGIDNRTVTRTRASTQVMTLVLTIHRCGFGRSNRLNCNKRYVKGWWVCGTLVVSDCPVQPSIRVAVTKLTSGSFVRWKPKVLTFVFR